MFAHADWRDRTGAEAETEWVPLRARRSHECLDVERAQVFMMGPVQMPGGEDRVWLSVDLLAADVDSVRLLMQEIGAAYAEPSALPDAPSTWFPAWPRVARPIRAMRGPRRVMHGRRGLATLPEGPALPLARAPETIRAPRFSRVAHTLSTAELARLQARAAQHGVTLSSVFGAAFAAVLARWSGRHAFLLNVPLFDRHGDAPDLGRVIADFTTLLLVECDLRADASAADAVRAFQQRLHGAIAQAAYPALDVLRDARRQGTPRAAPVVFSCNLGDAPFVPDAFARVFGDLHDMISQTPQVWLDHQLYRVPGGALLAWDSVDGLFPRRDDRCDVRRVCRARAGAVIATGGCRSPSSCRPRSDACATRSTRCPHPGGRARCMPTSSLCRARAGGRRVAVRRASDDARRTGRTGARDRGRLARGGHRSRRRRRDQSAARPAVAAVFGVLAAGACYVRSTSRSPPRARR